jgi:hypothetical protein
VESYPNLFAIFIAVLEENELDCLFQQDRAKAHAAKHTTPFLQDFFGDSIVRRGLWPP